MKNITIPVTAYAQNASLLYCEETAKAAVIDPGGDIELILAEAKRQAVTIERILITHGHFDHCGAALDLAEQLDVPIYGPHPADEFLLQSLPDWARQVGFPPARSFVPQQWLDEGDSLEIGSIRLQVIHCPGHTPGHLVFYAADAAIAFVGDVLFHGSIGRSDFPRGNHAELIRSIKHKLLPLGDEVRFIPGHGPSSTLGYERLHNPFLR
ncbi:MAG: MBL fold metallo-hydrolase [Gammaproteobacteria bacterium]|nr:MBL fold metallo-hydrolase [Gammaproteobacteria bacterium]